MPYSVTQRSLSSSSPPRESSSSMPPIPAWRVSWNATRQALGKEVEIHGNWTLEHAKLKARMETLQKNERNLMGEGLDTLSLKELQNLEHQIDSALKHIRTRKNQVMHESISELHKKDKALREQNNQLAKKARL